MVYKKGRSRPDFELSLFGIETEEEIESFILFLRTIFHVRIMTPEHHKLAVHPLHLLLIIMIAATFALYYRMSGQNVALNIISIIPP